MHKEYVIHDLHGNEVPIVNFTVFFSHDYGTDHMVMGAHEYPQTDADLTELADGIRRTGFRNPVVTGWIKDVLPNSFPSEGR